MNARHATPLVLTALTLALTACGNKGPLVLPTQPAPQEAPRAKPGEVPVTISNVNDPPVAADPKAKTTLPSPSPTLNNMLPAPPQTQDGEGKDGKTQDAQGKDGESKQADPKPADPTPADPTPSGRSDG